MKFFVLLVFVLSATQSVFAGSPGSGADTNFDILSGKASEETTFLKQIVVEALVEALKDHREEVRVAAAKTLGDFKAKVDPADIIAFANYPNELKSHYIEQSVYRAVALVALGFKNTLVIETLVEGLKFNYSDYLPSYVAYNLEKYNVKDPVLIEILVNELLEDPRIYVRIDAAKALVALGFKNTLVIKTLVEGLKDPEDYVRMDAAKTLGALKVKVDPAIITALIEDLKDGSMRDRLDAAKTLAALNIKDNVVIKTLVEGLKYDKSNLIRLAAAKTLGPLKVKVNPAIITALIEDLKDADGRVREFATKTLGALKVRVDPTIAEALVEGLKDTDGRVRLATLMTIEALKVRVDPAIITAFVERLNDPNWQTRLAAVKTLKSIVLVEFTGER